MQQPQQLPPDYQAQQQVPDFVRTTHKTAASALLNSPLQLGLTVPSRLQSQPKTPPLQALQETPSPSLLLLLPLQQGCQILSQPQQLGYSLGRSQPQGGRHLLCSQLLRLRWQVHLAAPEVTPTNPLQHHCHCQLSRC
jgi:hypothetical protein